MPDALLKEVPEDVRRRAQRVKLAAFDVDGVLTDGRLWFGPDGEALKQFHTLDGLGLKLLREQAIEVALITSRDSPMVQARARELGLRHVYQGQRDKLHALEHLCRALEIGLEQVAYTGDDLPDLPPMQRVGLSIAVANAHPWMFRHAHWRTTRRGGDGAVREVCDLLLAAQGKTDAALARHLAG
jgi:3-deoxy-D-manno-octulosonate 8-phosphate phosphatase (KDO 8-P phosphatase)